MDQLKYHSTGLTKNVKLMSFLRRFLMYVCVNLTLQRTKVPSVMLYSINFNNFEKFDILITSSLRFLVCIVNMVGKFYLHISIKNCLVFINVYFSSSFYYRLSLPSCFLFSFVFLQLMGELGLFSNCEKSTAFSSALHSIFNYGMLFASFTRVCV